MPHIEYVCLSDLHLGADTSILTNIGDGDERVDSTKPSIVLERLCECLRELVGADQADKRPTLILNGDVLELALSPDNIAAEAFRRFVELIMPAEPSRRLFADKIIYIPGNHDHHLWEVARETQYLQFVNDGYRRKLAALGEAPKLLPEPWHATKMIEPEPDVPANFLNTLIRYDHGLGDVSVVTVYPNFARSNAHRQIIFTHGHFTESIYSLMSTLADISFPNRPPPTTPYDLEAENFAWIDFFWSMMGRSGGGIGADVERIYEALQDGRALSQIAGVFVRGILEKSGYFKRGWINDAITHALKLAIAGHVERAKPDAILGDYGVGLRKYIAGPVMKQLEKEDHGKVYSEVSVVFGHTHKPFEQMMSIERFTVPRMAAFNSGGWVVDSEHPQQLYGGAVILISDELETVSLRMYNESLNPSEYPVRIATADAQPLSSFATKMAGIVRSGKTWKPFSEAAAQAVGIYTKRIARAIQTAQS